MKAIKKTEESLRKLKKIRDPNYKVNSDDDKIRSQLTLDIDYLLLAVSKYGFFKLCLYIYIFSFSVSVFKLCIMKNKFLSVDIF